MHELTREDIHPLEDYARLRTEFRARVIEHRAHRRLCLGEHVVLDFENRLTVHYRVQERLRAGHKVDEADIRNELEAFNPLIPDGSHWKATLPAEHADQRRETLQRLAEPGRGVWLQVDGLPRIHGVAREGIGRGSATTAPVVQFLCFELPPEAIAALKAGATLSAGVDHPRYAVPAMPVPEIVRESLIADLA